MNLVTRSTLSKNFKMCNIGIKIMSIEQRKVSKKEYFFLLQLEKKSRYYVESMAM